ncbi:MAG: hypothetical protein H6917_18095 [Novosphingobium sp.]|nr:hypothetical protein [Hyphomonas sp.]MCB2075003.1 hypothetical protein [Novosphingobium sp.]MCP5404289.1 hypothetical protein [Novosphingobium sp.]
MPRLFLLLPLLLAACQPGGGANVPGDADDHRAYDGIGADETLRFTGTEPFWGGQVTGGTLTWTTPENIEGTTIAVERFGGRGGLTFSGTLDGASFDMMVTPAECSDGMSDRTYPFNVTLQLGPETRYGCAWSDARPFTGLAQP